MSIKNSLAILIKLAQKHKLSTPYLVGGVPRNAMLGGVHEVTDFDITTGNDDAYRLAQLFAASSGKEPVKASDSHIIVHVDGAKFDFSKNFKYEDIDNLLAEKGMKNPTDMQREVFSRDFTINTLMLDLNYREELDLTGQGKKDIDAKILNCPLSCDISFKNDPKRILRAYYFKAKLGFRFSENLHRSLKRNMTLVDSINERYAAEMTNKILRAKPDILDELIESGLLQHLPMTKLLNKRLVKDKRLLEVI